MASMRSESTQAAKARRRMSDTFTGDGKTYKTPNSTRIQDDAAYELLQTGAVDLPVKDTNPKGWESVKKNYMDEDRKK